MYCYVLLKNQTFYPFVFKQGSALTAYTLINTYLTFYLKIHYLCVLKVDIVYRIQMLHQSLQAYLLGTLNKKNKIDTFCVQLPKNIFYVSKAINKTLFLHLQLYKYVSKFCFLKYNHEIRGKNQSYYKTMAKFRCELSTSLLYLAI